MTSSSSWMASGSVSISSRQRCHTLGMGKDTKTAISWNMLSTLVTSLSVNQSATLAMAAWPSFSQSHERSNRGKRGKQLGKDLRRLFSHFSPTCRSSDSHLGRTLGGAVFSANSIVVCCLFACCAIQEVTLALISDMGHVRACICWFDVGREMQQLLAIVF